MSNSDIIGLVLSYVYAFGLLLGMESLGRKLSWSQDVTRKIIHIGAGMWIWGILYFFENWYFGIIPFATFIILNYIFYRKMTFKAMDQSDSTLGTVYFALSITVLFLLFWRTNSPHDKVPIAAAAVMAMTWGDAFASLIGKRWGRRIYSVFNHKRSLEGSLAMFFLSFLTVWMTLWYLPGSVLSPQSVLLYQDNLILISVLAAAVATACEAISPAGTDNLFVPLLTAVTLGLLI